jgi:hypothetical protein
MDSNQLEELLSKYWKCETSLDEEQTLRTYFRQNNIPDSLKETAELFRFFEHQKKKSLNDPGFEDQVIRTAAKSKQSKTIRLFYNSMRIAAGVGVVVVAAWFVRNEVRKTTPQAMVDTYNDPKLAFEETKKALLMISKSFGKAEEQSKKINLFNEAQEEIKKKQKNAKM